MSTGASTGASTGQPPRLATPSLRRRVSLVVLVLVALMLVVLGVVTDRVLADRLDGQLRQRLVDRAGVAAALVDQVDGRDLARRLEGEGVSVVLTEADGSTYAEGPLAGAAAGGAPGGSASALPAEPAQPPEGGRPSPRPAPAPPAPAAEPEVQESGSLLSVSTTVGDDTLVLLADAGDIATTMSQVRLALLIAGLLVLLVTAGAVPLVVRRTLAPLDRITAVAQSITDGDRERRLRPTRPATELGRTATAFDVMLDEVTGAEQRATDSEARLRSFLHDAAHELRTPLTGVQAAAERVLRDDPDREVRERVLLTLVRESQRAGRLVDDMLLMAGIDRGLDLERRELDLSDLAAEVVAGQRLRHPAATFDVVGGAAPTTGDRDRLTQVVGNLLDNAVTAAGPHARVEVATVVEDDAVVLRVRDDGPGVAAADRERIFERLVRLDESRSTHRGGVGLGLPIARGLARAHGGELRCVDPGPAGGAVFELRLPRSPTRTTSRTAPPPR